MKQAKKKPTTQDRPHVYVTDLRIDSTPENVGKIMMMGGAAPRPETRKRKAK